MSRSKRKSGLRQKKWQEDGVTSYRRFGLGKFKRTGELKGLHMEGPKIPWRRTTAHRETDDLTETATVLTAKFDGKCNACPAPIAAGSEIIFNMVTKATYHRRCPRV